MSARYYSLNELIEMIEEPNKKPSINIYRDNKELFDKAHGSKSKHQAWPGGYLDHVIDVMNLSILFYDSLRSTKREIPFKLSDSLLCLYLHDIEKPFKQSGDYPELEIKGIKQDQEIQKFKERIFSSYGFSLSDEHKNAIKYCEGEKNDYDPKKRIMGELAAFCHMCDIWSARGWHNHPRIFNDKWKKDLN